MKQKIITSNGHTYDCVKDFGFDKRIGVVRDDGNAPNWFKTVEEVEFFYPNLVGLMNW